MRKNVIWLIIAIVLIIGAIIFYKNRKAPNQTNPSPQTDVYAFAQCLKDKGAIFYGAFWCPHCNSQKEAFGDAQKNLPYVECSTPDGQGQTQICKDNKIEGYPTWVFADGSRLEGEQSFEVLANKTGCTAPIK